MYITYVLTYTYMLFFSQYFRWLLWICVYMYSVLQSILIPGINKQLKLMLDAEKVNITFLSLDLVES